MITRLIRDVIEDKLRQVTSGLEPRELYDPISYTIDLGGKRIRPMLVAMGCELFSGNVEKAVQPAIAIELFHNFTLLHDDIMDKAPIRRGKETVYRKWNENTAILSGDTLFAMAYEHLALADADVLPELLNLFTVTAREVCEGQQLDMNFETRDDVSIEEYLGMIRLKTAVLLGCSLETGAITACASPPDSKKIYSFGENIGMAFQLQDDLLDTFGDSSTFGKEIGGDIVSNKKTFLYVQALESAGLPEKEQLMKLYLNRVGNPSEKIIEVKKIFKKLDIEHITKNKINSYFDLAISDLALLRVSELKKQPLKDLAHSLLNRKH